MKIASITLGSMVTLILFFSACKNKSEGKAVNELALTQKKMTGQMVVDTLENLGYFKYTDSGNLDALKKEIRNTFDQYKVLGTVNAKKSPFEPFCHRYYFCDGETLFEADGIVEYLDQIKPIFERMGVPLTWSDDNFNDDATAHTIIVNKKKYTAFKGDPSDMLIWGWATKNFVEMLNDQLALHQSDERVYPILSGNDGRIVFLTKPQYDFIFRHFTGEEKPMEVDLWWKHNTR